MGRLRSFVGGFGKGGDITEAIRSRHVISFQYSGGVRIVNPHLYGRLTTGHDAILGIQTGGYSRSGGLPEWRVFHVSKISGLQVLGDTFTPSPYRGNPYESDFTSIYEVIA